MAKGDAAQDIPFACNCGTVHGTLHAITRSAGAPLRCYCSDCRRASLWVGDADPAPDGLLYYQTTPDRITFDAGAETLRAFKWKNPRLVRWYAPCCGVTMFNTLDSPKWAFASLDTRRVKNPEVFGPVTAYAFKPQASGKPKTVGFRQFMFGFAKRVIGARLSGSWRKTPFFKSDGAPIAPIKVLTHTDRARIPEPARPEPWP